MSVKELHARIDNHGECCTVASSTVSRRKFLGLTLGAAILPVVSESVWAEAGNGEIPYRTLGRTGEKISVIGIGGAHLGNPDEQTAIRIVRTAIDNGITLWTTAGITTVEPAKNAWARLYETATGRGRS